MRSNKRSFSYGALFGFLLFHLFYAGNPALGEPPVAEGRPAPSFRNCTATLLVNRDYFHALIGAIDKANKDITLSFYHFKTTKRAGDYPQAVLTSLAEAAKRGVRVKVLLERSKDEEKNTDKDNSATMGKLRKAGIDVYLDSPENTTHTKLAVIDGKYTFIGSHNMTQSGLKYNNEISVFIESPQVASEALDYIKSLIP